MVLLVASELNDALRRTILLVLPRDVSILGPNHIYSAIGDRLLRDSLES